MCSYGYALIAHGRGNSSVIMLTEKLVQGHLLWYCSRYEVTCLLDLRMF